MAVRILGISAFYHDSAAALIDYGRTVAAAQAERFTRRKHDAGFLVNTSFNIRGEPIVCTPEDAFRCFMGTEIERLVVGNCVLRKEDQASTLRHDYRKSFALD